MAFDGSSRHAGFVLPILRDALAAGAPTDGLALVEALWARMCAATREDGSMIAPNDPNWDALHSTALAAHDRPVAWLEQAATYGTLAQDTLLADAFDRWLRLIWSEGTVCALDAYLQGRPPA